jgi:hypothetical protein
MLPALVGELRFFVDELPRYVTRVQTLVADTGRPWLHKIMGQELRIEGADPPKRHGRRQIAAFKAAIEDMASCNHVLLISTVPLVNAHLSLLERLFTFLPGHQSWQDDLFDQWVSLAHWEEWARFVDVHLNFSARTGTQVTSLSGEIHLGALGLIAGAGARIHQLTSSGIVHPPPEPLVSGMLEWTSAKDLRVASDITARLLPLPGSRRRYLRARNWLELSIAAGGDLLAAWHAEGERFPLRFSISAGTQ